MTNGSFLSGILLICSLSLISCAAIIDDIYPNATTHQLDWKIQYVNVTRLCHTKSLISVNGEYPGPTVYVREGDTVIVNVTNLVSNNVTLHWHGVRQLRSAWADGPVYITQCPIQTGQSYVHKFQVIGQRGTLFWHAHISWLRATLYGAFIIEPQLSVSFPFVTPYKEFPIVLGEWWNSNVEDVIAEALESGGGYNVSDAFTINGQPGNLYNCSEQGTIVYNVTKGKTYLLRVINAAVNFQLFFGVAGHNLTVVEADAEYTKPYSSEFIVLAPGQTTNVLLTANQSAGQYYIAASAFSPAPIAFVPFPLNATTAILNYVSSTILGPLLDNVSTSSSNSTTLGPLPAFPDYNDLAAVEKFATSLRSQDYSLGFYYMDIPKTIDQELNFTVGYALQSCSAGQNCLAATINNVSFADPTISVLQAFYNQISNVYESDFPDNPPYVFNYTSSDDTALVHSIVGTKVKVLDYNSTVQIVFQDTSMLFFESHPIHLHGQNFYIVGSGFGNFNADSDPANFNLVDPVSRNTVAVPSGGWAAIRFRATNPGVWYMHCHIDLHNSWGMAMAFVVKNGNGTEQSLPAPPTDLPPC